MSAREELARAFPLILAHEGLWRGTYLHLAADGRLEDSHASAVRCIFPDDGPFAYVQENRFEWADGRVQESTLPGVLRAGRLHWDVPTFSGEAWESDGVILLRLHRKDTPGAHFEEMISLAPGGWERARTWHWFKDGRLLRRTLCLERRAKSGDEGMSPLQNGISFPP